MYILGVMYFRAASWRRLSHTMSTHTHTTAFRMSRYARAGGDRVIRAIRQPHGGQIAGLQRKIGDYKLLLVLTLTN